MSVSMDESLNLRIASIFIMFFASMAGVMLPLYYARNADRTDEKSHQKMADSDAFRIVRTFAAGIMLGVAFIHLLYEGTKSLAEVSVDYPSLGFTLATIGTLIVLASEQITLMLVSRIEAENKEVDIELPAHPKLTPIDPTRLDSQPEEVKTQRKVYHSFYQNHSFLDVEIGHPEHPELTLTDPKRLDSQPEEVETQQKTYQSCCDHTAAVDLIARSNSMSVLIKAYMMEISIGIHSLIIGIAMGSLEGRENLESLRGLVIAICFHQFFEGLGLGTVLEGARMHLGASKIISFAVTFALTVPFGVAIGIIITNANSLADGPSIEQKYALGSLNSIAAGLMIYVALVQMIADDFKQSSIATNVNLKIKMFSALSFGTAIMAILGYWA